MTSTNRLVSQPPIHPHAHIPNPNRDTRGITSSNYLREEIRGILEGVFPEKGLDIEQADDARVAVLAAAGRATRAFRRWVGCCG